MAPGWTRLSTNSLAAGYHFLLEHSTSILNMVQKDLLIIYKALRKDSRSADEAMQRTLRAIHATIDLFT